MPAAPLVPPTSLRRCRFCSLIPTMGTPALVWQVLTLLSLVYTAIFTLPYLAKCVMYPCKVRPALQ